MNPNDCETCQHRDGHRSNDLGGWCYMWAIEPRAPCYQHTRGAMVGCVLKRRDGNAQSSSPEKP